MDDGVNHYYLDMLTPMEVMSKNLDALGCHAADADGIVHYDHVGGIFVGLDDAY